MASYDILLASTNGTAIAPNGVSSSISFAYPTGKTYLDYTPGSEQLSIPSRQLVLNVGSGFSVAYTPSAIVVYWSGSFTLPVNTLVRLQTGAWAAFAPTAAVSGVYNVNGYNLRRWRAALAKVRQGLQNAKVAFVGDSTTRGTGGAAGTGQWAKAYPVQVADQLNKRANLTGGIQNFFGSGNQTLASQDARVTNGWSQTAVNTTLGGALINKGSAGTFSFLPSQNVDTFDVYSVKTAATGSFTLNINGGGTLATVSGTVGTPTLVKTTVSGSLAANTLNAVWVSGTVYLAGVDAYDSTVKQISCWNMGASGAKATNLAATDFLYNGTGALAFYAPDLTVLMCGINDWTAQSDITQWKTDMQAVITAGLISGDVMLMTPVPSIISAMPLSGQKPYVDAAYALAAANNIPLIDNWAHFQTYEYENALGMYFDTLHPNAYGYSDVAQTVVSILLRN